MTPKARNKGIVYCCYKIISRFFDDPITLSLFLRQVSWVALLTASVGEDSGEDIDLLFRSARESRPALLIGDREVKFRRTLRNRSLYSEREPRWVVPWVMA